LRMLLSFRDRTPSALTAWSRLHLQSLVPTKPHWARVVGYGLFSLSVIHKEGLCPSSGDINRLMMKNKCGRDASVKKYDGYKIEC
jgi:hypothetical protein